MIFILRFLSKLFARISQFLKLGAGVTWSGEIALIVDPKILKKLIPREAKVILIAGTNGKTTTAKMLQTILSANYNVIHNKSGANLLNGLVGTILTEGSFKDKEKTAYVLEVDESSLPLVLQNITPDILVLLNLFRDQLDRYGEVDTIAKNWQNAFSKIALKKTALIANGDDPAIAYIGQKSAKQLRVVKYFGINDKSLFLENSEHAVDSVFCPNCGQRLDFSGIYLSHLGQYNCPNCKFSHPKLSIEASKIETSLEGLYMVYNCLAATLVSQELGFRGEEIAQGLKNFQPAFGRQEKIKKDGKLIKILLSKNPAGFNASLRTSLESRDKGPLLLVLNDRIPDGTDVSWIWDVDFEKLANLSESITVSGDRALDLALRLKYTEVPHMRIETNLAKAISESLQDVKDDCTLWILPTYSAMLEVRKILTGKGIL